MTDSPIRIAVELEGIEPNARFQAACDELRAAAAELMKETAEVTGFAIDGDFGPATVWTDMRPMVKGFNIGMPPTRNLKTTGDVNLTDRAPGSN